MELVEEMEFERRVSSDLVHNAQGTSKAANATIALGTPHSRMVMPATTGKTHKREMTEYFANCLEEDKPM